MAMKYEGVGRDGLITILEREEKRLDWLDNHYEALERLFGALVRSDGSLTLRTAIDAEMAKSGENE